MARLRTMVFTGAACAVLAACSSPPPKPPQPVSVKLTIAAGADVNPDSQNRPSPVVIRVYQLKDDAAFKAADFFALYDKEQATLGATLVSRQELELAPAEQRTADYSVSPDTRFIGVAAAYRDIRNAEWRAETGSADKGVADLLKSHKISIAIDRARVSFGK
ncbi:MAG TPA: type VI secretion system lipoprotein TssJ [Steroidobacteraceae bacterium]|nr:type VI secretion system lipoprotein TssJ [Steroidobacteraceae bacterium]